MKKIHTLSNIPLNLIFTINHDESLTRFCSNDSLRKGNFREATHTH